MGGLSLLDAETDSEGPLDPAMSHTPSIVWPHVSQHGSSPVAVAVLEITQ